jgi:serine/threonine protein kinase
MSPSREDLELYVSGNYDGDVAALERAIAEDPALAALLAEEAQLEMLLRDTAAHATFCAACEALVRSARCDQCGAAVKPGGYTVEKVLVSNAHGRMYVARDADGKRVALKELAFVHAPSMATVAAFEREAKFLRALEHPAIPRFCAAFEEGEGVHTRYYLAQELVDGTPLDQLDDHWYSEAEIIDIAKQVLGILVYLQSLSPMVIHRDIKPANLLKRADGSIALVDFGAAHVHGTTVGSTTIGTFGYMPLEQLAGITDATTDVYALGATLLYLLTRQEPWRLAQTKTTVNVSAPLRAYLDKLVAADPRNRFASAKDALAGLDAKEKLVIPATRFRFRWPLIATASALFAAGTGAFALLHTPAEERDANRRAAMQQTGVLRVRLGKHPAGSISIDGRPEVVRSGQVITLPVGNHEIRVNLVGDSYCYEEVSIQADRVSEVECTWAIADPTQEAEPPRLKSDKRVSWMFNKSPLHDVMRLASTTCGFNVIVPGALTPKLTMRLTDVPCGEALEVLLETQGLDYAYDPKANLVVVGKESYIERDTYVDDGADTGDSEPLPAGGNVDVDVKQAPVHDMLRMIADREKINLVIPEHIPAGTITIRAINAPWQRVFDAALDAQELWYKYRKNGKIISIGTDKEPATDDAGLPK